MKIIGMTLGELAAYTARQLSAIVPVARWRADRAVIERFLPQTLERLSVPTERVLQWRVGEFDPLLSSQHSSFLYILSNVIWTQTGDAAIPTKLFLLNKALHGVEVFFKTELPPVFLFVHTMGIVLVNTTYGNYFTIFQNSTVGRFGADCPKVGTGVVMFADTAVIGRCTIGDHTVISQSARVINFDTPGHATVFPSIGKQPVIKAGSANIIDRYYRSIDL